VRTNGARRVRPNRVVLAVVATAKPCGGVASPTGRRAPPIREVTEASRNSSPGRARHTPSDHRAGKAGRFSASPVYPLCICVCIFSHDGPRVPAGARPSLRPFFERGVTPSAKLGRKRREDEELCLRVTYLLSSPAQDIIGWAKRKRAHACRVAIELVGTALCAFARTTAPRVKMRFGGAR
jgi:hypothetical protein